MKRVAVVSAVALLASVLGAGELPARAQTHQQADAPAYQHYIGALHEHSGYSDGFPGSRPAHYFESAKSHGLDFLMSGEHSDNSQLPVTLSEECLTPAIADCALADREEPTNSFTKWDATLQQARAATDENFTGIRGFEWSSDRFGHINVYFSTNDTNAKIDGGYAAMDTFWNWFTRDPSLGGGSDGLATFNHPGAKKLHDADPAFNWSNFEFRPEADQRMVGLEVYNDNDEFGQYYVQALDKGWHVGAIGAEDLGHRPRDGDGIVPGGGDRSDDWGGPKWAKTVLIATDRSEEGLREAMLARRFYAVRDNSLRLELSADGRPMGSRITAAPGSTVPISAVTNGAARLELVTNGGTVAASSDGTALAFDAPVTDTETYYFVRVLDAAGKTQAFSSPVWIKAQDADTGGRWLAGDLHIHTTYSHDSYGGPGDDNTGPEEFYTLGHTPGSQFAIAGARGLDYLAITDHNDVRSQEHFDEAGGIIPVAGYENSLKGHAQMLGAERVYDAGDKSAAAVNEMADALRADGGVFQINHPMEGTTDHGASPDWKYGFDVVPDTIEVWNISPLWQPPAPSASSNDDAVLWWQEWLDRGYKVGATGGSDNHWVATTPIQGAGQPTTWVYAADDSEQAILEGLRAGRTFISHQPPNHVGPQLFIEADANRDGSYESMIGDTVPAGVPLRARVENAPGTQLRVLTDGGTEAFPPVPVTALSFTHDFILPTGTWVRAEIFVPDAQEERRAVCDGQFGNASTYCRNQLGILAMTSALYLSEGVDPSPTPTPTEEPGGNEYEAGETYARVTDDALTVGNGLVERTWGLDSFGTTSVTDLRAGGKTWGTAGPDFTLDLGAIQLSSTDFQATGTTVDEIEGPGLRISVSLTSLTTNATRVIEVYEGVAGFQTRTTVTPLVALPLSGYTLDSAVVGSSVVPTIHAFRAGADWRDPDEGWEGPRPTDDDQCLEYCPITSIGDPHAGTWRDSRSAGAGEALQGPAQWVSVADGDREAFLVMERNDQPSSRAAYDGSTASLVVDHSRDIVSLGPFEEQIHVENPTPAKGRTRVIPAGESFSLEPSFMGFGARDSDAAWQFHKYLTEHRLDPYAPDVTFNSNGTEGYGFSTGAKDDMVYDIITQHAPKAKALGIDTFILDDGWQANSGDWIPDCPGNQDYRMMYPPRYPDCDFTAVREAIAPMKLGLWMSPMHFNPQGSETFKAHPEWACWPINAPLSAYNIAQPDSSSNEAGLGMWGPDAIPHIEGRIRHAIEAWEVTYFKFDFLVWVDCAGQGDLYDYREAFRDMVDRLIADHPDVTFQIDETNDYRFFPFESVARGPSWFQNGSPEVPHLLHNLWNLSPYVPAFSLGQHFLGNNSDPSSVDTRMAAALLSHPTFFSNLSKLKDSTVAQARPWVDYYKANVDKFQNVVYPLLDDPIEKKWTGFQSWDPEKAEGALLAFRQDDASPTATVRLKNVPAGMTFDLFRAPTNEKIATLTSEQLSDGFEVTLASQKAAYVVTIKPAVEDEGPAATQLAFTGSSTKAGQFTDIATLAASLTDASGTPLAGQSVTFELVGSETRTFTATSNDAGIASVDALLDAVPGPYQLTARFDGVEGELLSSATTTGFVIEREDTDLTLGTSGKGSRRELISRLSDRDSNEGLSGRSITFTADGTTICTATTDNTGTAVCPIPARYQGGRHEFVATFDGNDNYLPSSATLAE